MLSIIIVNYNTKALLRACINSLKENTVNRMVEIIVVDNHSSDGSVAMLAREFPEVSLIANDTNLGFAAANNQALASAMGDYVLFINPDAAPEGDAVQAALDFMDSHPDAALCGGMLVNGEGRPQPSARRFPDWASKLLTLSGLAARFPASAVFNGHDGAGVNQNDAQMVDWVPGAFALCRRAMLERVDAFDERFFLYFEETDLCRALRRAGGKIYYLPHVRVRHLGGASAKKKGEDFDAAAAQVRGFRMRSEWLYFRKNHGLVSVLLNAGVELLWHGLRCLKNIGRPGRVGESAHVLRLLTCTLLETRFGRVSPPRPW